MISPTAAVLLPIERCLQGQAPHIRGYLDAGARGRIQAEDRVLRNGVVTVGVWEPRASSGQ